MADDDGIVDVKVIRLVVQGAADEARTKAFTQAANYCHDRADSLRQEAKLLVDECRGGADDRDELLIRADEAASLGRAMEEILNWRL